MAKLNKLLERLIETGADSLQFRAEQPPTLFTGREHRPMNAPVLTRQHLGTLLEQLLDSVAQNTLALSGQVDGFHECRAGEFRYRARQTPEGLAIAFRSAVTNHRAAAAQPLPATPSLADAWPAHDITALLRTILERRGSDLVVSSGREARARLSGDFQPIPGAVFNDEQILASLGDVLTDARRADLENTGSLDAALEVAGLGGRRHRFRVNVFRQMNGLAAAFRPIWDTIPHFDQLHLPPELVKLCNLPYGLILVTGPTGSGKSTTLSTLIEHINAQDQKHIITLEDPIEYCFKQKQSIIHQREVGIHVESFGIGLRAALREAPDVILVGEMRDLDTIAAALTAAETGHLVLSTLHSGSAAQAVDRIIDVFPEHQQAQVRIQLSDTLRAIVTQRLLPTADGGGRVPVVEMVKVTYAMANLIRDKRTHQFTSQVQTGRAQGMLPWDQSLANLVMEGLITREVGLRVARDPKYVESLIDGGGKR